MPVMSAVDEFEPGEPALPARPPAARQPSPRRRRHDGPDLWVGVAIAAVALGATAAPDTLPRASAALTEWELGVVYATADDRLYPDDALALADDLLSTIDDNGGQLGDAVVIVLPDSSTDPDGPAGPDDASLEALEIVSIHDEVLRAVEAAGIQSDWVCEQAPEQTTCTALADPDITVVVD